ncbi:MAG TPA: DUF3048 domain-containing protein [Bacilli bacterium]|nr:DUF3048 domain-containing protein [Bacilli bacterium]
MDKLKKLKIVIIILSILIVISIAVLLYFELSTDGGVLNKIKKTTTTTTTTKTPLQIYDEESDARPFGVMIDNVPAAFPQAGVQDAFMIYEMTVEGGLTRLFAVFKDVNVTKIGPVRSARHNYLDYALENNAIYVHYGFSDRALVDLRALSINNLSGTGSDNSIFWRDSSLTKAPHNAFTSSARILERAAKKYDIDTGYDPVLNYSVDEVSLANYSDKIVANKVRVPYNIYTPSYEYNTAEKVYYRFVSNKAYKDRNYNKQVTVKNIIVINVRNFPLANGGGKVQDYANIGTGTGYYITNGYAIPITYEKTSRSAQTVYKDSTGKEITVNDGNTFVQIQPITKKTTFE